MAYVRSSAALPTRWMFNAFWSVTLCRIRHVWEDANWAEYFQAQYLKGGVAGEEPLIRASWFYGLASTLLRGYGPWQLPLEQCNAFLKNGIAKYRDGQDLVAVVRELRKVAAMMAGLPEDRERSYSRLATPDRISFRQPTGPDAWALADGGGKVVRSALFFPRSSLRIPTIRSIVQAFHRSKKSQQPTMRHLLVAQRSFWAMRIGRPGEVPQDMAESLVSQLRARASQRLQEAWERAGILVRAPATFADIAPWKVDFEHLRRHWGQFCVVIDRGEGPFACTCPVHCEEGHCTHAYACEDIAGRRSWVGRPLPTASAGAAHERTQASRQAAEEAAGSSADEAPLLPKRARRAGRGAP